jgi:hypothetical protein
MRRWGYQRGNGADGQWVTQDLPVSLVSLGCEAQRTAQLSFPTQMTAASETKTERVTSADAALPALE